MTLLGFKTILLKKNVGPAKIQRVQQKIPGCWTYVQQNENKFQKVCMWVLLSPIVLRLFFIKALTN
jgi:hypothetical protein